MNKTWFISDTHFFHKNMYNFTTPRGLMWFDPNYSGPYEYVRPEFLDSDEGDAYMIQEWNKAVSPMDKVYFGGDFCMDAKQMPTLKKLNGTKILILGNHDIFKMYQYQEIFKRIYSYRDMTQLFDLPGKKRVVFTHCPSHPSTFYPNDTNFFNIHGHIHEKAVLRSDGSLDNRYVNVSVELTKYQPMELDEVREYMISDRNTYSNRMRLPIKRTYENEKEID